jgi:hypothetical protein
MGSLAWGIEGHAPPVAHAAVAVTSERSGIPRPRRFFVPAEGISTHPADSKKDQGKAATRGKPHACVVVLL